MKSSLKKIKIVLSGGGTGGSVAPLLAMAEDLLDAYGDSVEITWLGMSRGIERTMTARYPFIYKSISAGKWRRYFSLKNFFDSFRLLIGFIQSFFILLSNRPRLIMTAGSFISVPAVWAAYLLRIPIIIHQQDIRPGLANKLMAPCAKIITVAFEKSLKDYGEKAVWTGNPIRSPFVPLCGTTGDKPVNKNSINKPSVLILGGGTGSELINNLVAESIEDLTEFCKVTHITGREVVRSPLNANRLEIPNYEYYDLLDTSHIARAMQRSDLVITRAGLGTLSELSYLGKPTIVIPIPNSHQEDNAAYFKNHNAALVFEQNNLSARELTKIIHDLLMDHEKLLAMGQNMKAAMKQGANENMMEVVFKII